jgi:aspartate aminotransferase
MFFYITNMPKVSDKGRFMPASPIRKLVPFAEDAKRRGICVYHLNIGNPDIPTPEIAVNAVKNISMKVVGYGHSAGDEDYRRKLVGYYEKVGIHVTHNDMIITAGGSEALSISMMACLNTGDEAIVPEPFYANYYGYSMSTGIKIVPVTSTIDTGFALPPIEEFEKLITPKTKAIIICNPNNPTGYLYSQRELIQLRDIVKKHDLFLFSDEVYREFVYDSHPHVSAMNLKGIEEHAIMIDSVSKRFSSCGVRVGALISRNKDFIATALKFGQARLCPPILGQILAKAALDVPDQYYKDIQQEYLMRRNFLLDALNKIEGVYSPMPKGSFYTIAKLPIDDSDKFAQWMLSDFQYQNQTVMVAPASGFYSTEGLGKNEVRIAYVLNVNDLKKALKCLEEGLKVYPGRTI